MISIIMPVFNNAKYIGRAIDSVINQTFPNWELIIVDDGSSDYSAFIANLFYHPNIKLIRSHNQGVSSARNKGLKMASGDYIAFLDSDDYLASQMYENLVKAIDGYDLAVSGYCIETGLTADMLEIDENNPYLSYKFTHAAPKPGKYVGKNVSDGIKNLLETNSLYPIWNKLFKKSIIDAAGLRFNETLLTWGEDELFNYEYLKNCNSMICIDSCDIYFSTEDRNALSYKYDDNRFSTELMLRRNLIDLLVKKDGYDAAAKKQLAYVFCGKLILHVDNLRSNNHKASQNEILSHWEDIIQHDDVSEAFGYSGLASQFMGFMSKKYLLSTTVSQVLSNRQKSNVIDKTRPSIITDLLFAVTCFLENNDRFHKFNERARASGAKWVIDPEGF